MKRLSLAFCFALLLSPVWAVPPTLRQVNFNARREWDFPAQDIPTSTEIVFNRDVWVTLVSVTNTTAGSLTFSIIDRQGTPKALASNVVIAPNTVYVMKFDGRLCAEGVTWVASGAGLVGYIRGLL